MDLLIFNTRGKKLVPFRSLIPGSASLYTCGPTVYRYAHIGNLRTYLLSDLLVRTLRFLGYSTFHVKNITDVGHMRQEMLERGGDKVIEAARTAGRSPKEIAIFFTEEYLKDERSMNFLPADLYPRASEHVGDMIAIIDALVRRGVTYEIGGTIYFDISKCPGYGSLSGNIMDRMLSGHRSETDLNKKNPADFTLWKRAEPGRELKWDSPWGEGFPGWHIECTAMALKYLGNDFDFHVGGIDLVFPHHENEIAQAICARDAHFARYWVHGGHLLVDGKKMSKSAGNEYTLSDLGSLGFSPMDFRYHCLNAGYRSVMNYTLTAQKSSSKALTRMKRIATELQWEFGEEPCLADSQPSYEKDFSKALLNDLNTPRALAVVWNLLHSKEDVKIKYVLLKRWDRVLGLNLFDVDEIIEEQGDAYKRAEQLASERLVYRGNRDYEKADLLRKEIEELGYHVIDTRDGFQLKRVKG